MTAAEVLFEGHGGWCGEHRTVGSHRAWCYQCNEWCYPRKDAACKGCWDTQQNSEHAVGDKVLCEWDGERWAPVEPEVRR